MAGFPVVNFTQYQWEVNDQNYLIKWNNFQTAVTALQDSIGTFGGEVEQELADALDAAEAVRQQAIADTNAIKQTAIEAADTATTKAGEASDSAAAAAISAEEAQAAAAGDVINNGQIGDFTTWSSSKINALLTLDSRTTVKSDFATDEHYVDEGERTIAPFEYLWDAERAVPDYALSANGKYRVVPENEISRAWNPELGQYQAQVSGTVTNTITDNRLVDRNASDFSIKSASEILADNSAYKLTVGDAVTPSRSYLFVSGNGVTGEFTASCVVEDVLDEGDFVDSIFAVFRLNETTLTSDGGYNPALGFPQRISFTFSVTEGLNNLRIGVGTTTNAVGVFSFSLPQLVEGTQPGPIIVTEDAPVTRAADSVSTEGDQFNQYSGTLEITAQVAAGKTVATFGSITITSDSDELKTYTETYNTDIGTPNLTLGSGLFSNVRYEPGVVS